MTLQHGDDRHARLKDLLAAAIDLPADARQAFIDAHELQKHMQAALQHVVNEMSTEPLLILSK